MLGLSKLKMMVVGVFVFALLSLLVTTKVVWSKYQKQVGISNNLRSQVEQTVSINQTLANTIAELKRQQIKTEGILALRERRKEKVEEELLRKVVKIKEERDACLDMPVPVSILNSLYTNTDSEGGRYSREETPSTTTGGLP